MAPPDPLSDHQVDLNGKSLLITGGTGSFGRAFVKRLIDHYSLRRIVVFSRDEQKQFEMAHDPGFAGREQLRFFIGDVRDGDRLEMAMRDIDYVVHAAALKHVTIAEYNPFECIRTNVFGAENVVTAAIRCGVRGVIALSTDKAANPINLYGASKLASDKIFIAGNHLSGRVETRFSVVRYGNVLGSRGSVLPHFQRLLNSGATSLPITDSRMTRFCITLREGVTFVLSSLSTMSGGEIFVPKLPSFKVVDLAKALAPDLNHEDIGIRPGEKLHEVMITDDDSRATVELTDRFIIEPVFAGWSRSPNAGEATSVREGFRYSSDTNPDWLGVDEIKEVLSEKAYSL